MRPTCGQLASQPVVCTLACSRCPLELPQKCLLCVAAFPVASLGREWGFHNNKGEKKPETNPKKSNQKIQFYPFKNSDAPRVIMKELSSIEQNVK